MGSDQSRVPCGHEDQQRPDVYALVIYVPGPLGEFLDELRLELVPHCNPHAHVSVLPPRSLKVDWQTASGQARELTAHWPAFDVELTGIQIFPCTDVIYIEVSKGETELRRIHAAMNRTDLAFDEPFPYHPHITVAQEIPHERVSEVRELAQRRWDEFRGPRVFRASNATFVHNHVTSCWTDLEEYTFLADSAR